MPVPLIRPTPPRLSQAAARLREIEDRGIFSNFGPVNTAFEEDLVSQMFAGEGGCMTVCNATIGLMLAVQQAIGRRPTRPRYALMPAFTFAAAAHAAMWCGLTPLFCDIDPETWTACAADEKRLLARYGKDIAVVMPYATFGYNLDLDRYAAMTEQHGVPVVVDAAASLGTMSAPGRGFGTGFNGLIVYSMHATKSFATGEGGVIYSANQDAIAQLRQMSNFGFGKPRTATMAGLNAKLSEVGALLAHLRLGEYGPVLTRRTELMHGYRQGLPELTFQPELPDQQAHQFAPGLLPRRLAARRGEVMAALAASGIGCATYFSPHLQEQEYFIEHGVVRGLPVTDDVAGRIISLPLFDDMTQADLAEVIGVVRHTLARIGKVSRPRAARKAVTPAIRHVLPPQNPGLSPDMLPA
jgi:dTDP-4-amino-4,6-dideoxygalactose transaminase